jgi:hypothetical protein
MIKDLRYTLPEEAEVVSPAVSSVLWPVRRARGLVGWSMG